LRWWGRTGQDHQEYPFHQQKRLNSSTLSIAKPTSIPKNDTFRASLPTWLLETPMIPVISATVAMAGMRKDGHLSAGPIPETGRAQHPKIQINPQMPLVFTIQFIGDADFGGAG
jgi:hypothetical protein